MSGGIGTDSRRDYSNIIDNHLAVLKSLSVQCSKVASYSLFLRDELEKRTIRQVEMKLPEVQRAEAEFSTIKGAPLEEIKEMIGRNQTETAIQKLNILIKNHYKSHESELTLLSNDFNRVNEAVRLCLIESGEATVQHNKIIFAILKLIETLEKS